MMIQMIQMIQMKIKVMKMIKYKMLKLIKNGDNSLMIHGTNIRSKSLRLLF